MWAHRYLQLVILHSLVEKITLLVTNYYKNPKVNQTTLPSLPKIVE